METVIGFTAIAVALLIGLGALGVAKALHASLSWLRCYRRRCSSSSHCSMPSQ